MSVLSLIDLGISQEQESPLHEILAHLKYGFQCFVMQTFKGILLQSG